MIKKRTIKLKMSIIFADIMYFVHGLKHLYKMGKLNVIFDKRSREILIRNWRLDKYKYEYELYKYIFGR